MSTVFRVVLIAGSALFLCLTLYLIRKKSLDLSNSLRWFLVALVLMLMALFPDVLQHISRLVGIEVPSNLVFLIGIACLLLTSLSLSAAVSKQHEKIRKLSQEYALLEKRVRELEENGKERDSHADSGHRPSLQ